MQRMCSVIVKAAMVWPFLVLVGVWVPAHADLIRAKPGRSFPDIAGDIVGSQKYTYDPATQTGIFSLVNAPHLISLGPSDKDLVPMQPEKDGTLSQSLEMKLDREGRLVPSPFNHFEIRGTVVIGDQTYEGLLLEGKPTAFGAGGQDVSTARSSDVFDLSMESPAVSSPAHSAPRLISASRPRPIARSRVNSRPTSRGNGPSRTCEPSTGCRPRSPNPWR